MVKNPRSSKATTCMQHGGRVSKTTSAESKDCCVCVCVCLFFVRIPFFGWKRVGCRRPEPIKYKPVFLDPLGQGCFYTGQPPGGPMALLYFRCFQAPPEGKIQLQGASLNHI